MLSRSSLATMGVTITVCVIPLIASCAPAAPTATTVTITETATKEVEVTVTASPRPQPTVTVTEVVPPEGLVPPDNFPDYQETGLTWSLDYCNDAFNGKWISVNFDNTYGQPVAVEVTYPLYDGLGVWPYTVIPEGQSTKTFSAFDIGMQNPLCDYPEMLTVFVLSGGE